jgi:hypothetical protein
VVVLHNICEQLGKCHGCVLNEILVYMNVQPESLPLEHMVANILRGIVLLVIVMKFVFFLPVATHGHITSLLNNGGIFTMDYMRFQAQNKKEYKARYADYSRKFLKEYSPRFCSY